MPTVEQRLDLFRQMLRVQTWEQRLLRFIEEGRTSGFYHSGRGHEAVAAGACAPLRDDDYLFYDHRGLGQAITKGVPLDKLFADFLGLANGTTGGLGAGIVHIAWPEKGVLGQSGSLGGSFVLAAGVGISIRYRETDQVVLCLFGEGTANRGTFHEAFNAAAVWKLPVVWLCENNGWSVSVPFSDATSVPNVADRAAAYGIPSEIIDGMDPEAVRVSVTAAAERARAGDGPTLIEAKTYRYRGHYEGDSESYRTAEEIQTWIEKDPLLRYPERLLHDDIPKNVIDRIREDVIAEVEAAAEEAQRGTPPSANRVFEGIYAGEEG